MKKNLLLLTTVLASSIFFAQVGINTPSPTQTLDVNGAARVRQTPAASTLGTSNLLISQANGDIYQIAPNAVTAQLKIPTTVLSVRLATPGTTLLPGGNAINVVNYDTIDIVPQASIGSWNAATNTFTVNTAGVYQISGSIQLSDFSNASANFSIVTTAYIQNAGGLTLAGNKYSVNQVLSLKLNAGDTVKCNIITGGADTFYEENAIMSIIYTPL
ncbi:hypothetical protein REB14_17430 [Chryseobacterium sp. ES2]|uniref:C1q domain-containing protein n=1 Tax=Chryseobacterium metallicongregator TaxID=3073042 RepID=A0ABU1E834_9FLAO|nr:hypothetical protein [Chryseobacterium sp. ES2]MDR4953966.1 hypothetical protein [Chryseobacterium sp. ES2]